MEVERKQNRRRIEGEWKENGREWKENGRSMEGE